MSFPRRLVAFALILLISMSTWQCGKESSKKNSQTTPTASISLQDVPADWDLVTDWSGSEWEVKE